MVLQNGVLEAVVKLVREDMEASQRLRSSDCLLFSHTTLSKADKAVVRTSCSNIGLNMAGVRRVFLRSSDGSVCELPY